MQISRGSVPQIKLAVTVITLSNKTSIIHDSDCQLQYRQYRLRRQDSNQAEHNIISRYDIMMTLPYMWKSTIPLYLPLKAGQSVNLPHIDWQIQPASGASYKHIHVALVRAQLCMRIRAQGTLVIHPVN